MNENLLLSDSLGRLLIFDYSIGQVLKIQKVCTRPIQSICLSPDNSYIGVCDKSGACIIIESNTLKPIMTLVNPGSLLDNINIKIKRKIEIIKDISNLQNVRKKMNLYIFRKMIT